MGWLNDIITGNLLKSLMKYRRKSHEKREDKDGKLFKSFSLSRFVLKVRLESVKKLSHFPVDSRGKLSLFCDRKCYNFIDQLLLILLFRTLSFMERAYLIKKHR